MSDDFTPALGCLIEPALAGLATQLRSQAALGAAEQDVIVDAARAVNYVAVHSKVTRLLLLELNAARMTGRLRAPDPAARWAEFVEQAGRYEYWTSLREHYPTLLERLRVLVDNRCAAAEVLARRFARDRAALAPMSGGAAPELCEVTFGAGDSHRNGQAVAIVRTTNGRLAYKPRDVQVDTVLAALLEAVLPDADPATRIRVPQVLARTDPDGPSDFGDPGGPAGYGWAEWVEHRYCASDAELSSFYSGIGHWLAVMRLVGGVDLHAENVIAAGPVAVVVDCETLFSPVLPVLESGLGQAVDLAVELVNGTVLRTGMLPGRGSGLGWRGVDPSAVGGLPGQQLVGQEPAIVDAGTDRAHMGTASFVAQPSNNHPSPKPGLHRHWDRVVAGFVELTTDLRAMDRRGELAGYLAPFRDCLIRYVPRATEVYAEVARMLWHPVSLHDEPAAVDRARGLLVRMAETVAVPDAPDVVAAEVAELLTGDVPIFTTKPGYGRLTGPRGTSWLPELDLVADTLTRWRALDLDLECRVIRAALVSAYLNDGYMPDPDPLPGHHGRLTDRDRVRRELAASIVTDTCAAAVHGADGTVTWIAPVMNEIGWATQPLSPDVYGGAAGVAMLLAGYRAEVAAGRADPLDVVEPMLAATLHTMRMATARQDRDYSRTDTRVRPAPPGGYVGLGSQLWSWLALSGPVGPAQAQEMAARIADLLPDAVRDDDEYSLLMGQAGAVVPLLTLAARTGEQRWSALAHGIGERLLATAEVTELGACWRTDPSTPGLGGFAHGATGIGWALARLSMAGGDTRFSAMASAAFRYEQAAWDPADENWRDLRQISGTAAAWCHGSVGIGLAALDLSRIGWPEPDFAEGAADLIRRAAQATWRYGFGWNHTLCHGDMSAWELMVAAIRLGLGPDGVTEDEVTERVIGSVVRNGPVTGIAKDAISPGLLPGLGGIAYQLLRMHPDSPLPSVLYPGLGPE